MMNDSDVRNAVYLHLSAEFFAWLLYRSEEGQEKFDLGGTLGEVEIMMQDRLSFQSPTADKMRAVITGEDAPNSAETKAALASGKTIQDLKLNLRLEGATYSLSLKGGRLDIGGLKQETHEADQELVEEDDSKEALLLLRMQEYNDIWAIIKGLFLIFVEERTSEVWEDTVSKIRKWVHQID